MILPIVLIFISVSISRIATNSWFSPASFFSTAWMFFLVIPLIFAPGFYIHTNGLWFIVILCMSCSSGSILYILLNNHKSASFISPIHINEKKLVNPLIIINLISLAGLILLINFTSLNYLDSYGLIRWSSIPNLISIDRYEGSLSYPLIIKYSLYFIYPGNIISGIILSKDKLSLRLKIFCFMPLSFCIILGIIEGSRTSILLGSVLLFSTYFSSLVSSNNGKINFSFIKLFTIFSLAIGIFVLLFILIQWFRQGLDPIIFELIVIRLKSYLFGYLSAFTIWFNQIETFFTAKTFFSTFAGPLSLIGAIDRELGFYEPVNINESISTNIFTSLRGMISDFTIFGSILLIFLCGYYFQYKFSKKEKNLFEKILIISVFYSFTLYSPLISIFHYNSVFFSWIFVYFILKIN